MGVNPLWIQPITSYLFEKVLQCFLRGRQGYSRLARLSHDGIRWQRAKQLTNITSASTDDRRVATTFQHCLHMDIIDDSGLIGIPHSTCSSFNLPARSKPSHQLYFCISPDAVFSYSCFDDPRRASVRRIFAIFFHTLPKMVPGSRPSVIHSGTTVKLSISRVL